MPAMTSLLSSKNECQWSTNNFWSCKWGNWRLTWSLLYISTVPATLVGQRESDTLPARLWNWASMEPQWFWALHHAESKCDAAINDSKRSCDWFICYNAQDHCVAGLKMNQVVIVREAVAGTSLAYLPLKAAISQFMDVSKHSPLRLPRMQDQKLLLLRWHSLSWWHRQCVAFSFAYKGSQYNDYV